MFLAISIISIFFINYNLNINFFLNADINVFIYLINENLVKKIDEACLEPYLYPDEKAALYQYMDRSKIYFEFTSGGTTHQAAKRGLTIYSMEVGPSWISILKKEIDQISKSLRKKVNITYMYADIQLKRKTEFKDFKKYVQIYDHQKYNADLIYIDGQYYDSILANIYNQVDKNTIIFIHNLDCHFSPKRMTSYYDVIRTIDKSYILRKRDHSFCLSQNKISSYEKKEFARINKKSKMINFLRNKFFDVIERYQYYNNEKMVKPLKKQVWFFWYQGMEKAPSIIKICLSSIRKNLPDGNITVITKENFLKIVDIPSFVIEKLYKKKITITSFSDILRMAILSTHGGLWMDATIFTARLVPSYVFDMPYFTIRAHGEFKCVNGKWTGFFQQSYINNVVPKFCYEIFIEYMKSFDKFINYFLIDYILCLGYGFVPSFKRTIQKVPLNNQERYYLRNRLNYKYSNELYESILNQKDTVFFKNSWKIPLKSNIHKLFDKNSYKTIYGYLKEKYVS